MKHFTAPFFIDYDNDGDKDLSLCYLGSDARFYRNDPVNGKPHFTEDTVYLAQIALLDPTNSYSYGVFVDLNGDGKMDFVTGGFRGFTCFLNFGTISAPEWVKKDSIFINVNNLIGTDAKPEFGDLDGDGDFDLLAGIGESLLGGPTPGLTLGFRNIGTPTEPVFEQYQAFVAGIPDIGRNSYPRLADLNNDGKLDLLLGRDLASFLYYRNSGTVNAPVWTGVADVFTTETSHYWKNPDLVDIDNDGDRDLIYGTDDGNILMYQNNGTLTSPVFAYNGTYFPVVKVSGNSTASLADFDNDGDFDLITGTSTGQIRLVQNNGTKFAPQFALTSGNYGNMSTSSYSIPRFADFDKDGDYDVVTGATDGKVYLYLNNNGSFTQANWFSAVDIGWTSVPAPVDLDGDGDMDLLVGAETASNVVFMENVGNNTFTSNPSMIAGINFGSYNRPSFGDVDNDGDYDLIIGSLWGDLKYYENSGTATAPVWTNNSTLVAGIEMDQNSTPYFADIDGDTKKDLIIGDSDGNFFAYKNLFAPVSVNDVTPVPNTFTISNAYPNPFNNMAKIQISFADAGEYTIQITGITGEVISRKVMNVSQAGAVDYSIDFSELSVPSGVYLFSVSNSKTSGVVKIVYLK
ncbi:MAG: T9SS type A sorting domain-containing protein [Bacteroidetes bacterium]|nr:T9SS type A sorting domain-containing protein [Bacteroidota bacterium]